MNYNPSTIARIADINLGIRVDTGSLIATTYLNHVTASGQHEIYTIVGRITLKYLFFEVITAALSANASTVVWNATWSAPVARTVQPIGTKSAAVTSLAVGHRIVWGGGILATAATITTTPGISDFAAVSPVILGMESGVGTIGMLCEAATMTTGYLRCSLYYLPSSDGAYVEALV
jgi:hypothetical protein